MVFVNPEQRFDVNHELKWEISEWFKSVDPIRLWSHGGNFDTPILQSLIENEVDVPWHYRTPRCTRTLFEQAERRMPGFADGLEFRGIQHDALCDAIHQARKAQLAWKILG